MIEIEKIIDDICPNGVEYKLFNDVCHYVRGITYSSSQEITNGEDGIKVLRANNIELSINTFIFLYAFLCINAIFYPFTFIEYIIFIR